jgi:2-succinyl-6-hydroxy-2,4-cyclohexadiene-1-carboxylate synthase
MSDWRLLPGKLGGWISGEGPRLVFVHGFTQTSASWKPIAEVFAAAGHETVIIDVPGHGESSDVHANLRESAGMVTDLCGTAVYIGYSLGGRLCLHAAVLQPHLVRGLALIGGSPGIADDGERAQRRAADDALADHIVDVGVDAFLGEWLAQPLFGGLEIDTGQRADRLRNTAEGLAASLRVAGTGAQDSLWLRLHELTMPLLAIAGEQDHKFAAIGAQLAAAVEHGTSVQIPGAGHAAHLQEPQLVIEALSAWLRAIND